MKQEEMAKEEGDVEQQVWWNFARIQCKARCRAVGGAIVGAPVLEAQHPGGSHTKTEVHFVQAGGCLRTAQEVRTLFVLYPAVFDYKECPISTHQIPMLYYYDLLENWESSPMFNVLWKLFFSFFEHLVFTKKEIDAKQ